MASYDANINLKLNANAVERELNKLESRFNKLNEVIVGPKKGVTRAAEAFIPRKALTTLQRELSNVAQRTNTVEKAFARLVEGIGTASISAAALDTVNNALKGLATSTAATAAGFSDLSDTARLALRTLVPGFTELDAASQLSAKSINTVQFKLQQLLNSTEGFREFIQNFGTLNSVAGGATAALVLLAGVVESQLSKELYGLEQVSSNALKGLADDAARGVSELERVIKVTQGTANQYRRLIKLGEERIANVRSESVEAARAANTIAQAQKRLNDELREQADLIKAARGTNITELEAAKGRKSIETRKKREEFVEQQKRDREDFINKQNEDLLQVKQAILKLENRGISALEEKLAVQRNITNEATLQAQAEKTRAEQVAAAQLGRGKGLSLPTRTSYRTAGSLGFPVALPEIEQDRRIAQEKARRDSAQAALNQQKTNTFLTKGVTALRAQVAIAQQLDGVYDGIVASLEKINRRQGQLLRARQNRGNRQQLGAENLKLLQQINNLTTNRITKESIKNRLFEAGVKIKNNEFEEVKRIQKEVRNLIGLEDKRIQRAKRLVEFNKARRKQRRKERQNAQENALIGGAFPLLFGQGLGASAGGALGGFLGGKAGGQLGFGLSLVGTAIGQAFDDATKRVNEMGNALRSLDLNALEQSAIRVSEELKFQVEKLKESGQFARARALVEQTVARQTGSTATVIKDIANAGNLVKAAFDEVVASGSVLLGAVAAPFAAVLAGILKVVAEIFKIVNRGISFVGNLLRKVEDIIDPGKTIQKTIESIAPSVAEATAEMKKFAEELNRTLQIAQETADIDLAKTRIGPGNTADNKLARARIEYQRELVSIQNNINDKLKEAAKLTGKERIDTAKSILLLGTKQKRIAELNFNRTQINIKAQEELRIARALEEVEKRRARIIKTRLDRINTELNAIRERNQSEFDLRASDAEYPRATPFKGPTQEEVKQQKVNEIIRGQTKELADLNSKNLDEKIRKLKEETIENRTNLALNRLNAEFTNRRREAQESLLISAQNEIDLIDAKIKGNQTEVRINQQLEAIQRSVGTLNAKEIQNLRQKLLLLEQRKQLEKEFNLEQEARFTGAGLKAGFIGEAGKIFEGTLIGGGTEQEAQKLAELTNQLVLAQTEARALEQAVVGIGEALATTLTTGVNELVAGTKSAQEVFADFLKNIAQLLLKTAAQMIATYTAIGVARLFAGVPAGGDDSFGVPNIVLDSVIGARANGGPVKSGSPYIIGERGPELFVPRSSGRVVPNGRFGGGGGGDVNVVVNVDAKGSNAQGSDRDAKALGSAIGIAVRSELVKQKRPGGLLAS
jgi:hypothetical protein